MFRDMTRFGKDPTTVVRTSPRTFNLPDRLKDPARVFTCSFSDFFIEEADQWRRDAWTRMHHAPHLQFQVLTKRPERIIDNLPPDWDLWDGELTADGWPNVWMGVSVENQKVAEYRIPQLLRVPATIRFLSVEPMLGPLDLTPWFMEDADIHWVIIGAESGPGHRETNEDWVLDLITQCDVFDIPVFVKQLWIDGKLVEEPTTQYGQRLEFPMDRFQPTQSKQKTLF
jgi:protein gp37